MMPSPDPARAVAGTREGLETSSTSITNCTGWFGKARLTPMSESCSVRLVRHFIDETKERWTWRLQFGHPVKTETIGWWAPARDGQEPTWCKGPRLTEREAEELRWAKREALRNPPPPEPERKRFEVMPLGEWAAGYIEETEGTISPASLKSLKLALDALIRIVGADRPPAAIGPNDAKRFVKLRRTEVAPATVFGNLSCLRRIWNDEGIRPNPWATKNQRKQLRSEEKAWHWYQVDEIARVLDQCDAWIAQGGTREPRADARGSSPRNPDKWLRWKGMIALAYTAGLRRGEIEHLTWSDVDFVRGEITVQSKKSDGLIPWTTKDHEKRTIPLAASARENLMKLRETAVASNPYVFVPPRRFEYVMAMRKAGKWPPLRSILNNMLKEWRHLCEVAGVPRCEFHSLRKSCCTNWLEGGMPPHTVQRLMGHSSIETTIKYYSKIRKDAVAQARAISDRLMNRVG